MLEAGLKPGHSAEFRPPRRQAAGLRPWDKFLLVLGLARVIIRTAVEPFNQRHWVDGKDEDLVKQVEELVEIPGTATEERGVVLARGQPSDLFDVPDPITITTLAHIKVLGSKRQQRNQEESRQDPFITAVFWASSMTTTAPPPSSVSLLTEVFWGYGQHGVHTFLTSSIVPIRKALDSALGMLVDGTA